MDEHSENEETSTNEMLNSLSLTYEEEFDQISDLLDQLFELDFETNDWARLFYHQLMRLKSYNRTITSEIWAACRRDLLYILQNPNGEQDKGSGWKGFLERMNCESILEQRQLMFQITYGEQKSFNQLFDEHKEIFTEYFHKCIFFHSKVQVRGLIKDIDNLLSEIYGLKEVFLSSENEKRLKEKLKYIEINLDCSNKLLKKYQFSSTTHHNSRESVNNNLSNFLPSIELREMDEDVVNSKTIANVLRYNRWIVILGDPGSGKTSLLRWLTYTLAEAALRNDKEVILEGNSRIPVRIPILIRIGEFAAWINEHSSKTLIDYIGEQTWFSERYCPIGCEYILKELVYHGHALILLDGLDEIPDIGQRGEIVDLVTKFIDEYVQGPEFFSAFDHCAFESVIVLNIRKPKLVEMQPPKKSGGNQIIVTSRFIGYQFYPLIGLHIESYSLLLMTDQQAEEFVTRWITQVSKCIFDALLNEGIQIDQETMAVFLKKRDNAVTTLFANTLGSLTSNPSLLSLMCMSFFQSSNPFLSKSRIEVYQHTVQAALYSWEIQESAISQNILTNFLIELASYLHLQSPSGLIDVFDMEHLCRLVLQQQGLTNNRGELRAIANKVISSLNSNVGIFGERGLQVFGFIHLSFQEYFVGQGLLRDSSIKEIAKRIITFTIIPRFRQSLLLAIGWISLYWSLDDFNNFCNILVTSTGDYPLPFGIFLFFDAFDDMVRLPSKSIIFTALNSLLCNSSADIRSKYFLWNLCQLSDDLILEWMELYLKDDKYLFNFCQCFIIYRRESLLVMERVRKPLREGECVQKFTPVVYQKLWTFHNRSKSNEFLIDQTLRRAMMSDMVTNVNFNKELSLYILSHDPSKSNVHPLILSVINAICGGIQIKIAMNHISVISFSPKHMHRESSILDPIVKYLNNNQESHSIKIQMLINSYQNFLKQSLPSDISTDVVDTFIALICLEGLSQPSNYQKYKEYKAFPLALERFKWIWFYLNKTNDSAHVQNVDMNAKISFIQDEIIPIMNVFFSQTDLSNEQFSSFSLACATACKNLRKLNLTNTIYFNNNDKIDQNLHCQSDFIDFIDEKQLDLIAENISSLNVLEKKPLFLLNFLPKSLQQLYSCTIILPINENDSLPLVVFLSECLIHLENIDKYNCNFYLAIVMLQSLLKEYMLENYASVLFAEKYSDTDFCRTDNRANFLKAMKDRKLFHSFLIDQPENVESFISIERQRIFHIKNVMQNQVEDVKLFSASISLARLYQTRYRFRKYKTIKHIGISHTESNEVRFGIMNILDPILRILALHFILNMKDPLIFIEDQRDELQCQMFCLVESILPNLPLLTSTVLFIKSYTIHQLFPLQFQYMASIIGQKLNQISTDKQNQGQQAAYIALKQLKNSDLSPYLSEFANQMINMSEVLHFNSTKLYNYFNKITSYRSINTIFLSLMYLNELIFDVQNLTIYTKDDCQNKIPSLKDLEELWNELSKSEKIMSCKVATWITNSLKTLNRNDIEKMTRYLFRCSMIENNALPVIEKWLDYRKHKDFQIFAQYAALQLIIQGFNNSHLIDIIHSLFLTDICLFFRSFIERLFNSSLINSIIFRQFLIILQKNVYYSLRISIVIYCEKNFQLILDLEYERISSNVSQQTNPFLLMIKGCSKNLQIYLENYLHSFIIKDTITEIYIATLIKWILEKSIFHKIINGYNYIFSLLHYQQYPRIQKAILNGLNSVFLYSNENEKKMFLYDDLINNWEEMMYLWNIYSKDLIPICLLAYGNCLLALIEYKVNRNVSNKMKNILNTMSQTSSLKIVSIRANFCLSLIEQPDIMFNRKSDWFENKWNTPLKEMYSILLNQTLYERRNRYNRRFFREFTEYLAEHSDYLLDTFIIDFYNYLSDENNRNYLCDPSPDYISIAKDVINHDCDKFCDAVRKSSIGETNFKKALNLHYINNPDDTSLIKLYMNFGSLTIELVDMLETIEYNERHERYITLDPIKQVSNRNAIEKIFQLIESNLSGSKYKRYLLALEYLAKTRDISLLELHQRILRMNILSNDNGDDEWSDRKQCVAYQLMDMSCFENDVLLNFNIKFVTQKNIDDEFHKEIEDLDRDSAMFFRENPFSTHFNSISD